jgi:hypothetical protein
MALGGSMLVIVRSFASVRTRLFSYGFDFGVAEVWLVGPVAVSEPDIVRGGPAPGRRVCVVKVRLVSTFASFIRIVLQIASIISSSFKKLTSLLVG